MDSRERTIRLVGTKRFAKAPFDMSENLSSEILGICHKKFNDLTP